MADGMLPLMTALEILAPLPPLAGPARLTQWNPKCGCKGTVTTRSALIALVSRGGKP